MRSAVLQKEGELGVYADCRRSPVNDVVIQQTEDTTIYLISPIAVKILRQPEGIFG